jgi:hypothetical protein
MSVVSITCAKKKRYASQAAADSVIFSMRVRGSDLVDRLEPKACEGCNGWHLVMKGGAPAPITTSPRRGRPVSLPYKDDE